MKNTIAVLGFALCFLLVGLCSSTHAQLTKNLLRVGFLWDSPTVFPSALEAFHRGLRDLGWIDGQNLVVESHWSEGRFVRVTELAEELVRLRVDVIVAPTSIYTRRLSEQHR